MKSIVFHNQKFKAIHRVLEANNEAFDGKTEVIAAVQNFNELNTQMSALITELAMPIKSVYLKRVKSRKALVNEFGNTLNIGIVFASRSGDEVLLNTLKSFSRKYRSVSTNEMIEFANYFIAILSARLEEAAAVGISQEIIDQLQAKADQFADDAEGVAMVLGDRRKRRMQCKQLIKDANLLLRDDLDRFVSYHAKTHPDLSFAYNRVRWSRRRRVTNINLPTTSDISGMVKDALTGLPIAGATLNLIEHAHAITADVDGYYLFDELEAGEFTLTCHATGYEVPESVIINLDDNDSLIHNFTLTPVSTEA